jgi:hypothetical protein
MCSVVCMNRTVAFCRLRLARSLWGIVSFSSANHWAIVSMCVSRIPSFSPNILERLRCCLSEGQKAEEAAEAEFGLYEDMDIETDPKEVRHTL